MGVRMSLIFDEFFDFSDFLSNISGDGLKGVLCLPEERHVEATHVAGCWCKAEGADAG
jgi:hypothetical protein